MMKPTMLRLSSLPKSAPISTITLPSSFRALTLYPEWIAAILCLEKRIENSVRPPPAVVRNQIIALHSGRSRSEAAHQAEICNVIIMAQRAGWTLGKDQFFRHDTQEAVTYAALQSLMAPSRIVALAQIVSVDEPHHGDLSGWRLPDQFGIHLRLIHVLKYPLICCEALGYWEVPVALRATIEGDLQNP